MPAPPPFRTIADILQELNRQGPPQWIAADGYHALTSAHLDTGSIKFQPNSGIVVKSFANTTTGEVRTYIAKFLDIPAPHRELLWTDK